MFTRKVLVTGPLLALALCFATAATLADNLRVGAARIDITPPSDPANGKYAHEHLYVRAIVLDNGVSRAALIGADQSGLAEWVWSAASKQIAKELDCPIANILMSATHTHSGWGPGAIPGHGPPGMAPPDPNAPPQPIIGHLVDVVAQAKAQLQPGRVGFGKGLAYLNAPSTLTLICGPRAPISTDRPTRPLP